MEPYLINYYYNCGFPGASAVKNLPAMQELQEMLLVRSLGREDSLGRRAQQATPVFLRRNPMDREAWQATVHGVTKSLT